MLSEVETQQETGCLFNNASQSSDCLIANLKIMRDRVFAVKQLKL